MIAAALLAALAASAPAAWPRPPAEGTAVLWVPPESFADWEELAAILIDRPSLRLTVGVVPESLTPDGERALAPLTAEGRLELALRVPGDPILPLIASRPPSARPQDPPSRIALGREQFRLLFGAPPRGLCPGAGAVSPDLFPGFAALGLGWAASGDYAGSRTGWSASSGVVLVPFRAVRAPDREIDPDDLAPTPYDTGAFVLDEAQGLVAPGAALRFLRRLADGEGPRLRWLTVSEAVADRQGGLLDTLGVPEWPSWVGDYSLWTSSASEPAWELYALAAEALDRYRNSGTATVRTLDRAAEALYGAQDGAFFLDPDRLPEGRRRGLERRFRAALIGVFRRMRRTPPHALFAGRGEEGEEAEEVVSGSPTAVRISRRQRPAGKSWLLLENPPGSLAKPEGVPEDAAAAWRLKALRVEWDGESLSLEWRLEPPRKGESGPLPSGQARLEAYMDLNGVLGAGSIAVIDSRSAFLRPRDAWEYAVSVSSGEARLYRASPQGAPVLVRKAAASVAAGGVQARVSLPRSLLRGNPLRWGFAAATFPPGEGSPPASILATLEDQRAFFRGARTQGRLAAVRLPD